MRALLSITLLGLAACPGSKTTTTDTTTAAKECPVTETTPPETTTEPEPEREVDPRIAVLEEKIAAATEAWEQATLHAQLGNVLWAGSCADDVYGLCIEKIETHPKPKTTCGVYSLESVTSRIVAVPRDQAMADQAIEHFQTALKLYDNGKILGKRPTDKELAKMDDATINSFNHNMRLAVEIGDAQLALIDRDFEAAFVMEFPAGLDFTNKQQESLKRFDTWFQTTVDMLAKANKAYTQLGDDKALRAWDQTVKFSSLYRRGALNQWFADQLFNAPVPLDLQGDEELYEVYCDTLFDKAEPLEANALELFKSCVLDANKAKITGVWPEQCRHEYNEIDPATVL